MALKTAIASILLATACITATSAQATIRRDLDIPAQELGSALVVLARQAHIQVVYSTDLVQGHSTRALSGSMTPDEALDNLLEKTGLKYEFLDEQTVTLSTLSSKGGDSPNTHRTPAAGAAGKRLRIAQAESSSSSSAETPPRPTQIEEVIVTAQKRDERLQDVPVPVTVINPDSLLANNQLRFQDYYSEAPGVNFSTGFRGEPFISIRGITTGGVTHPTVGITIDDVPYGSSTLLGGGYSAPDFDPSDLARIEVLRGPQGTLYGANSLGGLIKFVTVDPSPEALSARVHIGSSSVDESDELGYNVRASANVPVTDTFAVSVSGFTRRDPGYIDDPVRNVEDLNSGDAQGGRVAALWRPSDEFSAKVSASYQDITTDGSNLVYKQPGLSELQQTTLRGTGEYNRKLQAYGATLTAKLGATELTAISGYSTNKFSASNDITHVFGALSSLLFGVEGASISDDNEATRFTQELRLTVPLGDRVEWLVGGYYTDEDTRWAQDYQAVDAASGAQVGQLFLQRFPTEYREYAAFSDLTFRLTDRFDVQIGGRLIDNSQSYSETRGGALIPGGSAISKLRVDDDASTYLVTPRFRFSDHLMVYARLASGYRPGGLNAGAERVGLPPKFVPDETVNYEIGMKGDVLDRALAFDVSLYSIDWKDIQLSVIQPDSGFSYTTNASRARSRGAELSLSAEPLDGLSVSAWIAWNDADLTEDFPEGAGHGMNGDRLPFSSRVSGNLSFDQEIQLTGRWVGSFGASAFYVGDRESLFTADVAIPREKLPSYAQFDLRLGLKVDTWSGRLFVNNLSDKRGVVSGGSGSLFPFAYTYIQPRTVGLTLSKTF